MIQRAYEEDKAELAEEEEAGVADSLGPQKDKQMDQSLQFRTNIREVVLA